MSETPVAVPFQKEATEYPRRLPRRQEWSTRVIAISALLYSAFYLFWRWSETLNPEAITFSLLFVLAESWGLLSLLLLVFTTWRLQHRKALPAPDGLSVDVFVTTYNEPLSVIRRTALGARDISYPHQTYILDDGNRAEIECLARDLGIGYITRTDNRHAKAGNLNNALSHTSGNFILQLDADHVPLPHILDRLLGFFSDPALAFVQTPQDFYNTDSFTHRTREGEHHIFEEQRFFFSLVQPGKDRSNAAFFCGSCGVIRRSALESIGGFATETVTEDMETSLLLHAKGWRSIYYAESLAYGLSPSSAEGFHVQRLRWGQGAMQIMRLYKPWKMRGLTLSQRLSYLASMLIYFDGIYLLMLYLAPIIFFFTGSFPVRAEPQIFLSLFVPYLLLNLFASEMLARGTSSFWMAARFSMAKFFTYIQTIQGAFTRGRLKFNVTPKGTSSAHPRVYLPQVALMLLYASSVYWSLFASRTGRIDYGYDAWGPLAWWINFIWASINFALASQVVYQTIHRRERREDYRFPARLPVRLLVQGEWLDGGISEDLNPEGASFRTFRPLRPGSELRLSLPFPQGEISLTAQILSRREVSLDPLPLYRYRLRFLAPSFEEQVAIDSYCMSQVVPEQFVRYRTHLSNLERVSEWLLNVRRSIRFRAHLLVRLYIPNDTAHSHSWVVLENWSRRGIGLLLPTPLECGTALEVELPGTESRIRAEVCSSRALETETGQCFYQVGLRTEKAIHISYLRSQEKDSFALLDRLESWLLPSLPIGKLEIIAPVPTPSEG